MTNTLVEGACLPFTPSSCPAGGEEERLSFARFPSRLIAFVIDSSLLCMVYVTGFALAGFQLLGLLHGSLDIFSNFSTLFTSFFVCGPIFLCFSYFTILHAYGGQTIGKAIMGIRVCRSTGSDLGCKQSLLRWLAYHVSALPFFAGFLWMVFDAHNRSWHDLLVRSQVVNCKA